MYRMKQYDTAYKNEASKRLASGQANVPAFNIETGVPENILYKWYSRCRANTEKPFVGGGYILLERKNISYWPSNGSAAPFDKLINVYSFASRERIKRCKTQSIIRRAT
jgi:hypothetical protein